MNSHLGDEERASGFCVTSLNADFDISENILFFYQIYHTGLTNVYITLNVKAFLHKNDQFTQFLDSKSLYDSLQIF